MAKLVATGYVPLAKASESGGDARRTARTPVLAVVWPPCRPNGPWTIDLRGDRDAITPRIVVPPIATLDDPRAELLAERFIAQRLPKAPEWQRLLLPGYVVASEAVKPITPEDYANTLYDLELLKGFSTCQNSTG